MLKSISELSDKEWITLALARLVKRGPEKWCQYEFVTSDSKQCLVANFAAVTRDYHDNITDMGCADMLNKHYGRFIRLGLKLKRYEVVPDLCSINNTNSFDSLVDHLRSTVAKWEEAA